MTAADETTIKAWLYNQWKNTRSPKFFVAGAIIGKVPDVYSLTAKYGIDEQKVKNFMTRFEIEPPFHIRDALVVIRSIFRWTQDKANKISQEILDLLSKLNAEKISMGQFGEVDVIEKPQYIFSDDVFDEPARIEKQGLYDDNPFLKKLVSKTETAKAYEKSIRKLYDGKALALSGTFNRTENKAALLETVNYEILAFFADKIESASTAEELYSVWKFLKYKQMELDEIIEGVKMQKVEIADEYWRGQWGLESFLDFLKNFKKAREKELTEFEVKAQMWDVDLEQMLSDEILERCDHDSDNGFVYDRATGERLPQFLYQEMTGNFNFATA